jgi:hypothetical protein
MGRQALDLHAPGASRLHGTELQAALVGFLMQLECLCRVENLTFDFISQEAVVRVDTEVLPQPHEDDIQEWLEYQNQQWEARRQEASRGTAPSTAPPISESGEIVPIPPDDLDSLDESE